MAVVRVFSGASWEENVGYCRAIKKGNFIAVSGTTAIDESGQVFEPGNAYAQVKRCFAIIEKSLGQLGASLSDVVRTRMFVTDISQWAEFGRAHREVFRDFPPACSMIEVKALIKTGMLVEIEVDAIPPRRLFKK